MIVLVVPKKKTFRFSRKSDKIVTVMNAHLSDT